MEFNIRQAFQTLFRAPESTPLSEQDASPTSDVPVPSIQEPLAEVRKVYPTRSRYPYADSSRQFPVNSDQFVDYFSGGDTTISTLNRFVVRNVIWQAQLLYETDGYASELISNIIDFAVGDGVRVDLGDDRLNKEFQEWQWSAVKPTATITEMQRFAMLSLIRDGDIFMEKTSDGKSIRLYPIDGRYIWTPSGSGTSNNIQAGIKVNDKLEPVEYIYNPSVLPLNALESPNSRMIPADHMIHVYRMEYAEQARGLSWIRKALTPLFELSNFERQLGEATFRAIYSQGHWEVPIKYLLEYDEEEAPDDPMATAERKAADELLMEEAYDDLKRIKRMPEGVSWHPDEVSGITNQGMVEAQWKVYIRRIARSVGISEIALTADPANLGFLASRIAYSNDVRFFQSCQQYSIQFISEVVEWFAAWKMENDPYWKRTYKGYELSPAAFPYQDPFKDASAIAILIDKGIISPQQAIRDRNQSVATVMKEIQEWAEFKAGLPTSTPSEESDLTDPDDDDMMRMSLDNK